MTQKEIIIAQYEKLIGWYTNTINAHAPWPAYYTGEAIGIIKAGKLLGILTEEEYQELKAKAEEKWDAHDEVTASSMGKKGGAAKTDAKVNASKENGKKGGRPRKVKEESK